MKYLCQNDAFIKREKKILHNFVFLVSFFCFFSWNICCCVEWKHSSFHIFSISYIDHNLLCRIYIIIYGMLFSNTYWFYCAHLLNIIFQICYAISSKYVSEKEKTVYANSTSVWVMYIPYTLHLIILVYIQIYFTYLNNVLFFFALYII